MSPHALAGMVLLILTVATGKPAYSHAPVVELRDSTDKQPIVFTWPLEISVAVYGYFENDQDVDVVRFSLSEDKAKVGEELYVHTLVPACTVYKDLLPTIAIVGPAQPALPRPGPDQLLPFKVKINDGAMLLENKTQGIIWYEPYSKKNYFWQVSRSLRLTTAGDYEIRIWSSDHKTGDYVLAIGTRERWGLREMGRAVRHMPRLLSHREIHSKECRQDLRQQAPSPNPLPADAHSN